MRLLLTTSLVLALACTNTTPAMAQGPSTVGPPWFGGQRIEMREHGVALTVPDGWIAFDAGIDAIDQLEAAAGYVDPDIWTPEEVLSVMADARSAGVVLYLGDANSANLCDIGLFLDVSVPLEDAAGRFAGSWADDPAVKDVEPPQRLDLPVGPAYLIRLSSHDDGVGWAPVSFYLLADQGTHVMVTCGGTGFPRMENVWLSIVESIELHGEQEPSPAPS